MVTSQGSNLNPPSSYITENFAAAQLKDVSLLICHELRTPLTAIQGVLRLLNTGQLGNLSDDGQRLLEIAINNTHRLTRLANAIENGPALPMTILSDARIEQLQLENDLHDALDSQELQLHYQPIISLADRRLIGFEALARWQHPIKGFIPPSVFIELAEKNGLIHRLGLWVLDQACHQLALWQRQFPSTPPLAISVNLSVLQLTQISLVQEVQKILNSAQIEPDCLKLELTESMLIDNHVDVIDVLAELRAMGVQICIDDFGIGYSSLGRLQDLPIDTLKIDRSFVQGKQWDINEAIIAMATKLGIDVIAEGVETVEDLSALNMLGCRKMQGYLFSEPVDSQTATELITTAHTMIETSMEQLYL